MNMNVKKLIINKKEEDCCVCPHVLEKSPPIMEIFSLHKTVQHNTQKFGF